MPIPTAVVPNNCAEILRLRRRDEHRSSAFLVPPLAAIGNNPSVSFADSSLYTKEPLFLLPQAADWILASRGGWAMPIPTAVVPNHCAEILRLRRRDEHRERPYGCGVLNGCGVDRRAI